MATFFRVQELEDQKPHDLPAPSLSTVVTDGVEKPSEEKSKEASPIVAKLESLKRFVAAFRGRRVVGVEVPLPEGYSGLVLRSDVPSKNIGQANKSSSIRKAAVKANTDTKGGRKASTRRTRRSKAAEVDVVDIDAEEQTSNTMDLDDTADPSLTLNGGADEGEVKTLKATQTFQSLLVWNADVAVDVGRDEYIRSLREWTALASEVSGE